jgi:cytochrome P450
MPKTMTVVKRFGVEPPSGGQRVRGWSACRDALRDTQLASDPRRAGLLAAPANNLLFMDGELHQRIRRLLMPYFTTHRLAELKERLEAKCEALLNVALNKPHSDLVADLVEPFVLDAILSVMEVSDIHRPKLSALVKGMVGLLEPDLPTSARRLAVNSAMRATMLFERDGRAGCGCGLHGALEAAAKKGEIPEKLARSTPVVVLHGGYENPLNQLGCLIAWAVENPTQFKSAAATAPLRLFEEIMRAFSPVRLVARWAVGDSTCDDHPNGSQVRRGDMVWVDLESANHDGRRFSGVDYVDLSRRGQHLGFGYGSHACPGTALARLEGQTLIPALLRVPEEVWGKFVVEWRDGLVARGPASISRRVA